jgi:ABC-type phosphate transport system substrate-binding protein
LCRRCLLVLLLAALPAAALAAGLYVGRDSPVTSISAAQLTHIFALRQTSWAGQERIRIFLPQTQSPEYTDFTKRYLGLFPYQLRRHWDRATFSGRATPPVLFSSDQALVEAIATTPGAIGFVPASVDTAELIRVEITP